MHLIQLRTRVDPEKAEFFLGKKADDRDMVIQVRENATVYKPNGQRLITLIRESISAEAKEKAYPFLHYLRRYKSMNRGNYSGEDRFHKLKEDGTVSNTNHAAPVRSAIAGYFDRNPRFPFCRETNFSTQRPEEWRECFPMISEVAKMFQEHVPERYAAQDKAAKATHPAYVIPGTPFTTLTVNNCVAGGYHRDAGDFKDGFGVLSVFRKGKYDGCHLNFPAYGVSVDLQDRDVILFDPHEIHGNTPFVGTEGEEGEDWERISVVFYFRQKMLECLSPEQELIQARRIRGGDLLTPTEETEDAS